MTKSPLTRRFRNKTTWYTNCYGLQYESKNLHHFLSLALHLQLYFSFTMPAVTHIESSVSHCGGSLHKSTNISWQSQVLPARELIKQSRRNQVLEIQQISYTIRGQKEKDEGSISKITQRRLKMNITKAYIWFN